MRTFILIILVIHTTTATLDLQKIKGKATTKLQKIQDIATSTIQLITDNIDLEKIQKYDLLHILPKIEKSGMFLEKKVPEYAEKIKSYFKVLKSLEGKDLLLAFDGSEPWVVMRRKAIEDQPNYYED